MVAAGKTPRVRPPERPSWTNSVSYGAGGPHRKQSSEKRDWWDHWFWLVASASSVVLGSDHSTLLFSFFTPSVFREKIVWMNATSWLWSEGRMVSGQLYRQSGILLTPFGEEKATTTRRNFSHSWMVTWAVGPSSWTDGAELILLS